MQILRSVIILFFALSIGLVVAGGTKNAKPMVEPKSAYATGDLRKLINLLDGFTTYQADFEQQTVSAKGKVLQVVKGVVKLQKPGQFYWQAFQPYPQLLVSNGTTIWQYDEDLEQVIVKAYKEQAQQIDLVQLLENPKKLVEFYTLKPIAPTKSKHLQQFELVAKDKSTAIKSIEFSFDRAQLASLSFVDALQQKTIMRFESRKVNQKIAAKNFTFVIPKGADVVSTVKTYPAK